MTTRSEADVKREIQNTLKALGCLVFRMNSGTTVLESKGRKRVINMAPPGTADLLAFIGPTPLWIECKAPGKQPSKDQLQFRAIVNSYGHHWICADNSLEVNFAVAGIRSKL